MKKYVYFLLITCLLGAASIAQAATGAIWTTNAGCGGVNINLYNCKGDVYLNGGPSGGGGGLPDGNYYVQVTTPDGTVLGKTAGATVVVSGGRFVQCYRLVDILFTASSGFTAAGYDTTTNPGNEYKVWASQSSDFTGGTNKTDNFKVRCCETCGCTDCDGGGGGGGGGGGTTGSISGTKFLDLNLNGARDASVEINPCGGDETTVGEPGISGWKIQLWKYTGAGTPASCADGSWTLVATQFTNGSGNYSFAGITETGFYKIVEIFPLATDCGVWQATSLATCLIVDLTTLQDITGQNFGNICFSTAGLTQGYWKTHTGLDKPRKDSTYNSLPIILGTGCQPPGGIYAYPEPYNVTTVQKAKDIFENADASGDGRKMLAAQLLAAKLNVIKFSSCNFNCAIYAGNVSTYFLWSVEDIIAAADTALCDGSDKSVVTTLITVLDQINNNATSHVLENQGGCAVTYP